MSVVAMLSFETLTFPTDVTDILLTSFHVCCYVIMIPLLVYSSLLISGSLGSILRSTVLILVLVAQYTILSHIFPGHRNWMEVIGVMMVLFGTILSSIYEIILHRQS